jgi:hypothetical protein
MDQGFDDMAEPGNGSMYKLFRALLSCVGRGLAFKKSYHFPKIFIVSE